MSDKFTFQDRTVFYKGDPIFTAPAKIFWKIYPFEDDKVSVVYDPREFFPPHLDRESGIIFSDETYELVNRNAFLIDARGDIVWRIENPYRQEASYAYVSPTEKGVWTAMQGRGFELDIDMRTGKVSNPKFVK